MLISWKKITDIPQSVKTIYLQYYGYEKKMNLFKILEFSMIKN